VKALGWSQAALVAAARELQLSPACTGMFPRGGAQLAEHWVAQANAALAAELQAAQQQYSGLPVRQRITAAVRRRLEMNQPVMDSWPQVCVGVPRRVCCGRVTRTARRPPKRP
jgi:ubiquinone biosynthesis protein COQ9